MLPELTTNRKGAIAEAAITKAAVAVGIDVYRPALEGGRFDLIFDMGDRLLRVQCKSSPLHGDTVVVRCYSARRARSGLVRRKYTADEVDAFAVYCPELDRCYFIPFEVIGPNSEIRLRVSPARNNQRLRIRRAEDFDFEARLSALGPIAQLGERVAGSDEVGGSSPPGSTQMSALTSCVRNS